MGSAGHIHWQKERGKGRRGQWANKIKEVEIYESNVVLQYPGNLPKQNECNNSISRITQQE